MENAGTVKSASFLGTIVVFFEHAILVTFSVVLPNVGSQHRSMLLGVFEIFLVGNMGAEVATANVRIFFVDSFAAITPDASPSTCKPGQIAAIQICVVFRVNKLDPRTREILILFNHG
jgi:hypothetical protein